MQAALEDVFVGEALERYIVTLVQATRTDSRVTLGASPRGSLALLKLARAEAAIRGRDFVLPDDVKAMAVAALAHRLVLRPELWVSRTTPAQVVERLLQQVPTPAGRARVSWHPTALNVSFLTLVGWALFLAVVTGRADLVIVAIPLVVAADGRRRRPAPPALRIDHQVSAERLFEDERATVTLTLRADGPVPLVELLEPLPSRVHLERGRHHAFFTLRPGAEVRWEMVLRCVGRQHLQLGGPHLRLWGPLGLAAAETRHRAPRTVAVYPQLVPLRHLPRPLRTQTFVGNYVSPAQGEGIEPGDIRPFAPGDHVRHVNWRATLRLGTLHVTQHHRERNADVVLLLDTLSDVGPSGATVVDVAVRAAATLASAYLARKDRVGLIEYGGQLRWVKPGSGRAQLQRLLDTLLDASVVFTYVTRDVDLDSPAHPAAPGARRGAQPAARRALRARRDRSRGPSLRSRRPRGVAGGGGARGGAGGAASPTSPRGSGPWSAAPSSTSSGAAG